MEGWCPVQKEMIEHFCFCLCHLQKDIVGVSGGPRGMTAKGQIPPGAGLEQGDNAMHLLPAPPPFLHVLEEQSVAKLELVVKATSQSGATTKRHLPLLGGVGSAW